MRIVLRQHGASPSRRKSDPFCKPSFDASSLPRPSAPQHGRNAIIDAVETPYLLYMDDDTEFWPETRVERLLEAFPRAPDVSLVAGSYAQPHKRSPPDVLETTPHAKDSEEFRKLLTRNVKGLFVGINSASDLQRIPVAPTAFAFAHQMVALRCAWVSGVSFSHL